MCLKKYYGRVVQLNRTSDSGSEGQGFESLHGHQLNIYVIPYMKYLLFFCVVVTLLATGCSTGELTREQQRDAVLAQIKAPDIPEHTLSILDFGAMPDGVTDCKPAFEQAMMSNTNGVHIVVPEGIYFIDGPLHLQSNVCIDLQKGAALKFTSNPDKYLPAVLTSWEGTMLYNYSPLIYGYQLENVSIIGEGIIDGNAAETFSTWRSTNPATGKELQYTAQQRTREMNHNNTPLEERRFGKGDYLRPHLLQLFECKSILIQGVTMTNSPFWCVHLLKCENATVRAVNFIARNVNNDGIDPEYSRNILIEDMSFDNGDDNVAIKAGRDHEGRTTAMPSENIIIRNCKFKGLHGVVIGSEMSAGVCNVFIENCSFGGYCKRGIFFKSNPDRGGFIKNIYINNVHFGEVEDCFYITSFYHGEGKDGGHYTDISHIYVDSLSCRKARAGGIIIQGFPELPVHDIYLSNVRIDTVQHSLSITNAKNVIMSNVIFGEEAGVPTHAK